MDDFSIPGLKIPDYSSLNLPIIPITSSTDRIREQLKEMAHERSAERICDIIVEKIKYVQSSLKADQEVALLLASFGQSVLLSIESIEPVEPSCLVFTGYVGDQKTTLIQHVSQLSILINIAKIESDRPAHRYGF